MTGVSGLRSFQIELDGLTTFQNDLGTRSFLSVLVNEGKQAVCDLVRAVDRAFAFLGLQTFYKVVLHAPQVGLLQWHHAVHTTYGSIDGSLHCAVLQDPQPHVSLAWAMGDCAQTLQHAIDDLSLGKAPESAVARRLAWQQQVWHHFCIAPLGMWPDKVGMQQSWV